MTAETEIVTKLTSESVAATVDRLTDMMAAKLAGINALTTALVDGH